ncbi:MAG: hypothetical protein Q9169_005791 [Polycauliona sp. 2 TL-2023]
MDTYSKRDENCEKTAGSGTSSSSLDNHDLPLPVFERILQIDEHSQAKSKSKEAPPDARMGPSNLQVSRDESAKIPPSNGPAAEATPYMLVTTETYRCLLLVGTIWAMTVRVPHHSPPLAAPETSRPTMKASAVGAEALMTEPISKKSIESRYTVLIGKRVHSCPKAG